jgi:hypothetical protein
MGYVTDTQTQFTVGRIPHGECHCGCGQRTTLALCTRDDRGWIKGEPTRFVLGHQARKRVRYVEVPKENFATPCWLWQLSCFHDGYGALWKGGRMCKAHRVYYEEQKGPVPDGTELDHLCRERQCVNPDHLEPVSHFENCRRGSNTKLTASSVADIRSSSDTQRVLARRYGVTQGHISRIKGGQTWGPTRT